MSCSCCRLSCHTWQRDLKHRPRTHFRSDTDHSLVPFYDAIANGKSKAGTLCTFCGKEWIEDFLPHVVRHSYAVVSKTQAKPGSLAHAANRKQATVRHCVNCIHDEIYKHFPQLRRTPESILPALSVE